MSGKEINAAAKDTGVIWRVNIYTKPPHPPTHTHTCEPQQRQESESSSSEELRTAAGSHKVNKTPTTSWQNSQQELEREKQFMCCKNDNNEVLGVLHKTNRTLRGFIKNSARPTLNKNNDSIHVCLCCSDFSSIKSELQYFSRLLRERNKGLSGYFIIEQVLTVLISRFRPFSH